MWTVREENGEIQHGKTVKSSYQGHLSRYTAGHWSGQRPCCRIAMALYDTKMRGFDEPHDYNG